MALFQRERFSNGFGNRFGTHGKFPVTRAKAWPKRFFVLVTCQGAQSREIPKGAPLSALGSALRAAPWEIQSIELRHQIQLFQLGRHVCRTKLPPQKCLNQSEKWFEKREKESEKRSEMWPNIWKPLSGRLKIFHRHFSKSFSPPKICTKKVFFFILRGSAGVATLTSSSLSHDGSEEIPYVPLICRSEP